jgi:hypothetical protein
MKIYQKVFLLLIIIISSIFMIILFDVPLLLDILQAQTCSTPPISDQGKSTAWKQNATIEVNINPNGFTPAERQCVAAAFEHWNNSTNALGNDSKVHFNVRFDPNLTFFLAQRLNLVNTKPFLCLAKEASLFTKLY